ncbi:MAG: citrate/2-methylcitrate synthase, partial [Fimbriiglobus sp.]
LYYGLGLEPPLYPPMFAMSRIAGWAAHAIEQLDHNQPIRPRARYVGPGPRAVKPLADRV